ncbi:MAG: hypothetical protein HGA49_08260 [Eubacteriaceae bacterium]|nr:hypothetical protein [Eubacteriaceae bacterium]
MYRLKELLKDNRGVVKRGWLGIGMTLAVLFIFVKELASGNASQETWIVFGIWLAVTVILNFKFVMQFFSKKA